MRFFQFYILYSEGQKTTFVLTFHIKQRTPLLREKTQIKNPNLMEIPIFRHNNLYNHQLHQKHLLIATIVNPSRCTS